MTAVSGKYLGVGLKHARIFALDSSGYPAASGSTAYAGLELAGPKAFDVTVPAPRRISHTGNDRVLQTDTLPPLEGASAELRAAAGDMDLRAAISSINVFAVGDAKIIGMGTDQQGSEPQFGLLLYQQAVDRVNGGRCYRGYILPKATIIPNAASMNENPQEFAYAVTPQVVTAHLWGTAFAGSAGEGFDEAQLLEIETEDEPHIETFKASGSEAAYSFSEGPATATGKINVWKNGVLQTSGSHYTPTVNGITFAGSPSANDMIVALFEKEGA